MGFQGTGIVVLPDEGAQAPKHVADTYQMYVCVKGIVYLVGIKNLSEISGYLYVVGRVKYIKFVTQNSIMRHNVLRLMSYCKGSCGSDITFFLVCEQTVTWNGRQTSC